MVGMAATKRRTSVLGSLYKDSFEEHRWRCIFSPDHARGTLKPFATLHVNVSYCRDLIGNKSTFGRLASSDPYYEIYVDDKLVFASKAIHGSVNPNFKDGPIAVQLYHPLSIIRVQIMDEQRAWNKVFLNDDILGFVEFPARDLPLKTPVHGLCELRFRTMLLGQASERVKQHITHRDESLSAFLPNEETLLADGESLVPVNAKTEFVDVNVMSTMALRKKKRKKGILASCCIPNHSGEEAFDAFDAYPTEVEEECHLNGGECFVELFLDATQTNEFFAVCLPRPKWTNFPPPIARRTDLPQVDLQQVIDTYVFVKEKVFDRSLLCAVDFVLYLLTWQNVYLSVFNLCMAVVSCLMPDRFLSIVFFNIGVYLALLSSPKFRTVMTVNANTVPLNDLGYQQVASLNNPTATFTYLRRVIKSMHGSIRDEDKAEFFAALAVRDGVPALYDYLALEAELRLATKEEDPWVEFAPNKITEDSPVVIHPATRDDEFVDAPEEFGTVVRCNPDGTYIVFSQLTQTNKCVDSYRIQKRLTAPYVPQWIIPTAIENQLRGLYSTMSRLRDQLIPLLMAVRKIVCWESWWTSFAITVTCFAISLSLLILYELELSRAHILRYIKAIVGLSVMFAIFVLPSWWCQRLLTICSACIFTMRHLVGRKYQKWAFFHEMTPGLYTNQELRSLVRHPF